MITFWLCLTFFLSGVSALVFENLWFYQAGLTLGNSVWASSLVLAGFMGGLALGNALAARFGDRARRPVHLYALLELAIGASGLALVYLLPQLTPALVPLLSALMDAPWILNPLRLALALAIMLVPATAMGATLPVMVAALFRSDPHFGRVLGRLYGWNTIGAVLGALVGELGLIKQLGISGTGCAAASLNALAAGMALVVARRAGLASPRGSPRASHARLGWASYRLLAAAALLGFTLLALEVVWVRFLSLSVQGTSASFAVMLAVVLAGIGVGGLVGARVVASFSQPQRLLPTLAFSAGILCVLLYAGFDSGLQTTDWLRVSRLALSLMFPVALLSGVLFTLVGAALDEKAPKEARSAGLLTFANTTGAMLGSLAGGFLLLPVLGIDRSLQLLAAAYGAAALLLWTAGSRPVRRLDAVPLYASAAGFALALLLFPSGALTERHLRPSIDMYLEKDGSTEVATREGRTETIVYMRKDVFGEPVYYRLLTDGFSMSATSVYAQRYMKLFVYLPVSLNPDAKSALLISYGVGVTATALADTATLATIDVVDISRDVLESSRIAFPHPADFPLDDPRFRIHVEDGRHFLQTTRRRFDLITGEPPPPKLAGIVSLYTSEYFALLHERLTDGGLATYWLPVHALLESDARAITRAFCDAFDDCSLWTGAGLDWILVGSRGARGPVSEAEFARQWKDAAVARELSALGFETPEQLGALFLGDAEHLRSITRGVAPVTDDWPKRLSEATPDRVRTLPAFVAWMDTRRTRERFEGSAWIARLWPEATRLGTLPYFDVQEKINRSLLLAPRDVPSAIGEIDGLLTRTELETLPLWSLGSDFQRQRAARQAIEKGRTGPLPEAELGLGSLASRDYERAARHFGRARALGGTARKWLYLEIYSRCMAGPCDEIGPQLEALRGSALPSDSRFLRFLTERFEIAASGARRGP
jgi:spermidine synthase